MVAERNGVVIHQFHDVGDVLALRDGARGVALQEITATDDCSIGCIRLVDSITQACHLLITIDAAMGVVFVENHNALLSKCSLPAHHQGYHANV